MIQRLTNRGHAGTGTALPAQQVDHANGIGTTDAISGEATVALEVEQGPRGGWAEDAVWATAVESELIECTLQGGDIIAT